MPSLHWQGKEKVINHHLEVPFRVLEHQYGFNNGKQTKTETHIGNKIIHGDNLEALKALLPEYEGQIKCIYIDPPYNTGVEKWVFNDNVNHPKIKKWLGEVVKDEDEDFSRHDKWLCMMYPRLSLLKKLLDNDGVILISIDDNELNNLLTICNEIFGRKNFVTTLVWEKKKKGTHLDKKRISIKEYIVVYCKDHESFSGLIGEIQTETETYPCINPGNSRSTKIIRKGTKSNFKEKNHVLKTGSKISSGNMYLELLSDLSIVNGILEADVIIDAEWRYTQENLDIFKERGELYFTRDLYLRRIVNDIRYKKLKDLLLRVDYEEIATIKDQLISELLNDEHDDDFIKNMLERINHLENLHFTVVEDVKNLNTGGWGSNEDGDAEIREIFGRKIFDFPKPSKLLVKLFIATRFREGVFLDSFSGTGTTAHALLKLNKIDGGNRNFILVEMEDYSETITAERVKRVIKGYGETEGTVGSFDYYELGENLFQEDGNLNESVGIEKIRNYIYYSLTKSPLKILAHKDNKYFLNKHNDTAYYFFYEPKKLTTLNHKFLSSIKTKADQYVIYADNCLLTKEYMLKHNIIFKKNPRDITRF